jgi:hypothetical protein
MRTLSKVRLASFLIVLVAAAWARSQPVSAMDDGCEPSCIWCDSGSPCYLPGGDPAVCDQWDQSDPWEACNPTGVFCYDGGNTYVKCTCLPCVEEE